MSEALLAKLILTEAVILISLSFKTFLRRPATKALDCVIVELGLAPSIIGFIFLGIFFSKLFVLLQIYFRFDSINSADQLLLAHKLLQASLVGFLLFLSIIIFKFRHLMRECSLLKKNIKAEEKQLMANKHLITVLVHELEEEVAKLRAKIKKLEPECERITYEANAKKASVLALKQQCEGFNLEYDRLLEYNQSLQNQLQSIDQVLLKNEQETDGFKTIVMPGSLNLIPRDIQEPDMSRPQVWPDTEVVTTNRCLKLFLAGGYSPSSPRHRRPICLH